MIVHRPATLVRDGLLLRAAAAAVAALAAAALFGVVADLVYDRESVLLDRGVLAEAVEHRSGPWTGFFEAVSTAAEVPLAVLALVVAVVVGMRAKSWAPPVLAGAAGAGAVAAATVVKDVVSRARPDSVWQLVAETGYSFPSRHTTVATALLLMTAYLLAGRVRRRLAVAAVWAGAVGLAGLVAASRVYLGVHWATDVTAAAGLGATWALIFITGHLLLRRRSARGKGAGEETLA